MNDSNTKIGFLQSSKNAMLKANEEYERILSEEYDKSTGYIYSAIGMSNSMAYIYVAEVVDYLEDNGFLKKLVKKYANNCLGVYKRYFQTATTKINPPADKEYKQSNVVSMWKNMNIQSYSKVEKQIAELENVIKDKIKRHYKNLGKTSVAMAQLVNSVDYTLYTKLYTARSIIEMATYRCECIFTIVSEVYSHGYDYRKDFPEFHLQGMLYWWKKVMDILIKVGDIPRFNMDERVKKVYNNIHLILCDENIINDSALKALEYDPSFAKAMEAIETGQNNE